MKHTPGPWAVGPRGAAIYGPDNMRLAALDARKETLGQRTANALLMAAAPDLLEMLEACVKGIKAEPSLMAQTAWRVLLIAAREAMAQAKGEQPQ